MQFFLCSTECAIFFMFHRMCNFFYVPQNVQFFLCSTECAIFFMFHRMCNFFYVPQNVQFFLCSTECAIFFMFHRMCNFFYVPQNVQFFLCSTECAIFLGLFKFFGSNMDFFWVFSCVFPGEFEPGSLVCQAISMTTVPWKPPGSAGGFLNFIVTLRRLDTARKASWLVALITNALLSWSWNQHGGLLGRSEYQHWSFLPTCF